MRLTRIHVDQSLAPNVEVQLGAGAAEHVARVLRMRSGDALVLFNGDGNDYPATLTSVDRRLVQAQIAAVETLHNEAPFPVVLAQALARGDKMDLVVQKAVELGATGIVPLITEHSNVRLDEDRATRRVAHWQAVAISACEQCGRAVVPVVARVQSLADWCSNLDNTDLRLALLPGASQRMRDLVIPHQGVTLVAGPEGGLSQRDFAILHDAGFAGMSLGPRILRTETAGLAALAALQSVHGDC